LRAAIGDDARSPRFIRTIHGYGYAFFGDATVEAMRPRNDSFAVAPCRIILGDREIALTAGDHVLGRSGEATVLIDDAGVSRHHARITVRTQGATLLDLGSKNGTIVNGSVIHDRIELTDGAVIVLGATALKFKIVKAVGSTETATAARIE